MNIAVLGTGIVGNTIASKLVELGHKVKMGSRKAGNEKAVEWAKKAGANASEGSFADAAAFGEILFNCTSGGGTLEALRLAGANNLRGKILIDVSNPLDFSRGMPPTLSVCNTDSLAEQIQREFPEAKVVKSLNTMNCYLMVNPAQLADGQHDVFVSGNDAGAKAKVTDILKSWFGWKHVLDLGDITSARGPEMFLPLWLRMWGAVQTPNFSIHVVR
jgi:8-hydroxy-5-deazaflavin:NADPH oxidoreductase